jgi:hypothetical protein
MSALHIKNKDNNQVLFYESDNYIETTEKEFKEKTLSPIYTIHTENVTIRKIKYLLSIIILPILIYNVIHFLIGKLGALPATNSLFCPHINQINKPTIDLHNPWKYKRLNIEIDGYNIDAMIMVTDNSVKKDRWVLNSCGNYDCYENTLQGYDFKRILTETNSNGILFNYPGVKDSSGMPSRTAMQKAYTAMLKFLEDSEKGIGAKEIIGYGHSIGGGVQGDVLNTHELKEDIKYVFVKSRTFSDLSTTASSLMGKWAGLLVKFFGWNINSVKSSKNLKAPEIILQTHRLVYDAKDQPQDTIINDGVIRPEASLEFALKEGKNAFQAKKIFMGIKESHNDELYNNTIKNLANHIEECLA